MPIFRRPDGALVKNESPVRGIMPYIMRGRNESAVYFEQRVALKQADAFMRQFNEDHPEAPVNIQHLVMWTITQVLGEFPTMNRFVAGGRLYQRRGIWFSYSAKQSLKGASPLLVLKREFHPAETFEQMAIAMAKQLHDDRYGGRLSPADHEAALILKLPGLARRLVMAVGRFGDAFGLLPGSMIRDDPMYASAFFANLASIGLDACYHHLYEYGSIGVFCVIGRGTTDPGSPTSGPDRRRTMTVRWTFDERTEDGLVAGYALKRAKQILEDPATAVARKENGQTAAAADGTTSPVGSP
jgi:hypothetical protein